MVQKLKIHIWNRLLQVYRPIFGVKIDYLEFDVKSIGEKAVEILKGKLNGDRSSKIIKIPGKIKK